MKSMDRSALAEHLGQGSRRCRNADQYDYCREDTRKGFERLPQLPELISKTAENFSVQRVSADKAYISYDNFDAVESVGGSFFPMFKSNTTGERGGLFAKTLAYFHFQRQEYLDHYHKRSNVESTFSAVKRKFGDAVRSKTDAAMKAEVLCKFIAHNLTCLIQEQETLGIARSFGKMKPSATY